MTFITIPIPLKIQWTLNIGLMRKISRLIYGIIFEQTDCLFSCYTYVNSM